MLAQARTKKIRQKKKILADIYTQNLQLVGKAPRTRKKAPFGMGGSIWLAGLIVIGVLIATESPGSLIRQGLAMLNNPAPPASQPEPAAALPKPEEVKPEPQQYAALSAESPGGTKQAQEYVDLLIKSIEDKSDMQEYVNLLIQGFEDKSAIQEPVNLLTQSIEDKNDMQEYVNLLAQSVEDKIEMQASVNLLANNPVPIKKVFGLDVKTIIIDAGHGGEDPGAVGAMGTREKEITLDIARKLKQMLEATGQHRVLLTRSTDTYISLKERTIIANENGGDLFLSIHVNFLPGQSMNIIETLYFGPPKNKNEMQLAEKENEGSGFSISDYNHLIKKLSSTMKLQESRFLAQSIQQHLFQSMYAANQEMRDFGVKRAPFVVLLGAEMPGVLVEVSCLSNRGEEQRLRDPAYRETIAGHIETGVIKYLELRSNDYDKKRAERDVERNLLSRN